MKGLSSKNVAKKRDMVHQILLYSSGILGILFVAQVLEQVIESKPFITPNTIRLLILSLGTAALMYLKRSIAAEIIFPIALLLLVSGLTLYPLYAGDINPSDFIITIASLLVLGALPILVYHPTRDLPSIIFSVAVIFILTNISLIKCIVEISSVPAFKGFDRVFEDELMIPFVFVASFIFLNMMIYRQQLQDHRLSEALERSNEKLMQQLRSEEIKTEQLRVSTQKLKDIEYKLLSTKTELESKAQRRSNQLQELNEALVGLNQFNSEVLNHPLEVMQRKINDENLGKPVILRDLSSCVDRFEEVLNYLETLITKGSYQDPGKFKKEIETYKKEFQSTK